MIAYFKRKTKHVRKSDVSGLYITCSIKYYVSYVVHF